MTVHFILSKVLTSLFSETDKSVVWFNKGYASSFVDGVEILSKTQEVTTASPDISKTMTLVEILGLPAANVAFDESEITKNDLHILEQRTEAPRPTTIEIPDIPTKITILEEYKNVKNTHYSEELEDINPQEKKEEGLPPPYARVCETNTECPRGYRCLDATCVRGCDYTDDCPNDYHCKYGRYGYRCFEKPGRSRECKAHGQFCRRHSHCCTGYCGRRSKGRDLLCTPMPGGVVEQIEAAEEE
jgi:hypothetical protein